MKSEKLENFISAFNSGGGGCYRECDCGKIFYYDDNIYSWEEGEIEKLRKNKKAISLDYSVGTIIFDGKEFVMDCDCWDFRAINIMNWMDKHGHSIAKYFKLEKERKIQEAKNTPEIKMYE